MTPDMKFSRLGFSGKETTKYTKRLSRIDNRWILPNVGRGGTRVSCKMNT